MAINLGHGLRIDARTAVPRWGGEQLHAGIAVDALLFRARKAAEGVSQHGQAQTFQLKRPE